MLVATPEPQATPSLAIRLVHQMSRARIVFVLVLLASVLTAPEVALLRPTASYGSVCFMALLAIYSYFAADWSREYARRRLDLVLALTVLGDVAAVSAFIYGMGAAHSHFFVLLLCDVVFVAIFFHGLELAFMVGIVCVAYAAISLGTAHEAALPPSLGRDTVVVWQVLVGLITAVALAWLAHGLGVVLELERVANERLIRYLTQAVCLVSEDGRVVLANPEFERLSQAPLPHVVGHGVTELRRRDAAGLLSVLFAGVEEAMAAGETQEVDCEVGLEAGEEVTLRRTMVPCPSVAGRAAGWVVIWQDITEITAAAKARERGLVVVSHEMRSPLASLGMIVEVLTGVTGELDEEKRQRMLGYLGHETDRLARLVATVMDLSRFDSPDFKLSPAEVNVAALVERVTAMFVPRCEYEGRKFLGEVSDGVPTIMADEDRLEQVLINLCDNAVTYTPAGGTVKLTVTKSGDTLSFAVADTGPGISPEYQERIFDRFDRGALGGDSQTHAGGGLGLGLALTKRIVELHGGTIRVESEPGQGATFIVDLPLRPA